MSRRITAEMTCSRCGRIWYADYNTDTKEAECTSLDLVIHGPDGFERKISYDTMCGTCMRAVATYVNQIDKLSKASPQRKSGAKKKAPVLPAPHSD